MKRPRLARTPAQGASSLATIALAVMALLGAGCGGSARSSATSVTRAELALMALPKYAFGTEASGLTLYRPISGFMTNAKGAKESSDPHVTTASLNKAGRLRGYARQYSLTFAQGKRILSKRTGLLAVTTVVDVYRSGAAAAAEISKRAEDGRALVGKPLKGGAKLERFTTFQVQPIGDGATGWRLAVRAGSTRVYLTQVDFRDGRLLASVVETRAGPENVDAAVVSDAHALDRRIKAVLGGDFRTAA